MRLTRLNRLMKKGESQAWVGKFDHASVVMPELFRSLNRKSGQRQQPLCIEHAFKSSNVRLRFESPEQLGVDDLRVFQALVGLATQAAKPHRDARKRHEGRGGSDSPEPIEVRVCCTVATLAKAGGYLGRSKQGYDSIRASVWRLGQVTVVRTSPSEPTPATKEPFIRLASEAKATDELVDVGFHRALENAILAVTQGEAYVKVNLGEARRLKSDPARLLHHRLSYLNEGATQCFKEETLESYIWPEAARADSASAAWCRRETLGRALEDIKRLGWQVFRNKPLRTVEIQRARDERSNPGTHRVRAGNWRACPTSDQMTGG